MGKKGDSIRHSVTSFFLTLNKHAHMKYFSNIEYTKWARLGLARLSSSFLLDLHYFFFGGGGRNYSKSLLSNSPLNNTVVIFIYSTFT